MSLRSQGGAEFPTGGMRGMNPVSPRAAFRVMHPQPVRRRSVPVAWTSASTARKGRTSFRIKVWSSQESDKQIW